jgi:hypothetical protein
VIRALAVMAVIATVVAGCVSVATPPSAQPSLGPSFGVTTPAPASPGTSFPTLTLPPIPTIPPLTLPPIPTLPPVTLPPVTLPPVTLPPITLPPPTVAPPTNTPPTDTPPTEPPVTDGDRVFADTMDDPASGWGTYEAEFASVAYTESVLRVTINVADSFGYGSRPLNGDFATVLVASDLVPNGVRRGGLLCVGSTDSGAAAAYGVVITAGGGVNFISVVDGTLETLEENPDVNLPVSDGVGQVIGLACSGTSAGALRLVAFGTATGPLATYQDNNEGPATFSAVGIYADSGTGATWLDATTAAAYAIPGSDTGMTPEGEELLTHVPSLWQDQCIESPRAEVETAAIVCFLQQDGAGPELASYESYASNTDMDAAYQDRLSDFAVDESGSCESGPEVGSWNIDGETMGNLLCAPQQVGTRVDWTDNRLAILSSLIDFEGNYGLNFEAWQEAGPNL